MPLPCRDLKLQYESLMALKDEFALKYEELGQDEDTTKLKRLKEQIEAIYESLLNEFWDGRIFAYDKEKARAYGFKELKIERHEGARALIEALINQDPELVVVTNKAEGPHPYDRVNINPETYSQVWKKCCPDLPGMSEFSAVFFEAVAEHRLVQNPRFGDREFLLKMDFPEFDLKNAAAKDEAISPETKAFLQRLFGTEYPDGISRNKLYKAIWEDEERGILSKHARAYIQELLPGQDPDQFEFRLIRFDEYVRAAHEMSWAKRNFWTQIDDCFLNDSKQPVALNIGYRILHNGIALTMHDPSVSPQNSVFRLVLCRRDKKDGASPTTEG